MCIKIISRIIITKRTTIYPNLIQQLTIVWENVFYLRYLGALQCNVTTLFELCMKLECPISVGDSLSQYCQTKIATNQIKRKN